MKLGVVRLGCPKNDVDLEEILGYVGNHVELVSDLKEAEAILVHTCAFIEDARRESIDAILAAAQLADCVSYGKKKKLFVSGCLPQRYNGKLQELFPEVDQFFSATGTTQVANDLCKCLGLRLTSYHQRKLSTPSHYAYLTIADGCDNRCSYCAIPLIKGNYRSRPLNKIVDEARILTQQGVRELILIAQDTTRYGTDRHENVNLANLLYLLADIPELRWIRLMYAHPAHWTGDLTATIKDINKVCKYLDLPIQHISDRILASMGRFVNQASITRLLEQIRSQVPDVAVRTSLIVGYPGETENEFQELLDFIQFAQFDRLGVFCYSKEEGTRAFGITDSVPDHIKEERRDLIMATQLEIVQQKNRSMLDKKVIVTIDGYDSSEDLFIGRTQWDAPEIDNRVLISKGVEVGTYYQVLIADYTDYDLIGIPIRRD